MIGAPPLPPGRHTVKFVVGDLHNYTEPKGAKKPTTRAPDETTWELEVREPGDTLTVLGEEVSW